MKNSNNPSPVPGRILSLILLTFTILLWPGFLERVISLDRVANLRLAAHGLQLLLGIMTVASLRTQRWINVFYVRAFPTRQQLVLSISCLLLSLIVSLGFAEIACRFLEIPFKPQWTPAENALAQFDPELGWSYIPNISLVQPFGSERRKVAMHFDDVGSRVRAPGDQHDRSAPSVIFVGGSYTMGHGLFYEETFAGQLDSRPEFSFQVVNFGVQAYGTDQSLLLLKRYFSEFNTKVVVYGFTSSHVERNENYDRRLLHPETRFLGTKPKFALKKDGTLYLDKRPLQYEDLIYSRIWALLQVALLDYGPPRSLDLTRALLREMRNYVESAGATLIVLFWSRDEAPAQGLGLKIVNPTANPPSGWHEWEIPGDKHPDARANLHVARLLLKEFKRLVPTN